MGWRTDCRRQIGDGGSAEYPAAQQDENTHSRTAQPRGNMTYQSTNPFDGKILQTFQECSPPQLEEKLARASDCFQNTWRNKSFPERAAVLARAASLIRERSDELAKLITLEMGKLIAQSRGEVALSAAILDYYAQHAERFLASEKLPTQSGEALVESCPIGVLFGVEPWNFPYYLNS
ncbi:MAG: aldehyde dehydrogenase family protein [Pseudomonadaceae bacterium]|nr:aldehyde dehydrogenase family protein [Pseudomonadaceae bacterium]